MRKTFIRLALAGILIIPMAAMAATFSAGDVYQLGSGNQVPGNAYLAAGSVAIDGQVMGDVTAAGGTLMVSGLVQSDALLAGGTINVLGSVQGDLRAAGGTILVAGSVGGDVALAGGHLSIANNARITGDVAVVGGRLNIEGPVMGNVLFSGGSVYINNAINGNVEINAQQIQLGPQAVISGNLSYHSANPAVIDPQARIVGQVNAQQPEQPTMMNLRMAKEILVAIFGALIFLKFLMQLAGSLFFVLVFRRMSKWLVGEALGDFWNMAGRGFIVLILVPAGAFLVAFTILGLPIGILAFLGYIAWIILAHLAAPLIVGTWLYRRIFKEPSAQIDWKSTTLGVLALSVAGWFPFIGWAFKCVFVLAALGAIAKAWHKHIWLLR